MKKALTKLLNKMGVKKVKKLNNNKGFSLIELLIVIAIMGVLAAIAFNMFGSILGNSKKKADEQQANNIQKAITLYCVESGDWGFGNGKGGVTGSGTYDKSIIDGSTDDAMIAFLLSEVDITGDTNKYGPMLSPKYLDKTQNGTENINVFMPQWAPNAGGKNEGYAITIDPAKQSVSVKPVEDDTLAIVDIIS